MQSVKRCRAERDPDIVSYGIDNERDQEHERHKQGKDRQVKPERIQPANSVIDCEQSRNERSIRLIARQRTKCRRVGEESRNISQLADRGVVYDRVRVVEMKAVVKMIRVSRDEDQHDQYGRYALGHQNILETERSMPKRKTVPSPRV